MRPDNVYLGGGSAETAMVPAVAALLVLTVVLTLVLPRKYVIIPFLLSAMVIPRTQTLVFGGLHFFVLRVELVFAWLRMLMAKFSSSKGLYEGGLDILDKVFLVWAIFRAGAFLLVFSFESGAVVNQAAFLMDVIGTFFLLKYLIQDEEDILRTVQCLAVIAAIEGAGMAIEKLRGINLFGYLGGSFLPGIRDGAIRAQGSLAHPILAGTFGATLLPLFLWLWNSGKSKGLAGLGVIGSTIMVLTAASSTPLMAFVAGIIGLCFWPVRKHMRRFRWGLVVFLFCLQFAMKAPVWFLIARVDLTGASSGYHRAMLVDTFMRHIGDWWLIGTNTNDNWGYDMWDLSNEFVAQGISGGLVAFVSFIAMISICLSRIGRARKAVEGDRGKEWFFWCLGAAIFAHIVGFFGISYFDHTQVAWFALLIMINTATLAVLAEKTAPEAEVSGAKDLRVGAPPRAVSKLAPGRLVGVKGSIGRESPRMPQATDWPKKV